MPLSLILIGVLWLIHVFTRAFIHRRVSRHVHATHAHAACVTCTACMHMHTRVHMCMRMLCMCMCRALHAKIRPRAHASTAELLRDSRGSPASAPRRCRTRTGGRTARRCATSDGPYTRCTYSLAADGGLRNGDAAPVMTDVAGIGERQHGLS